MCSGRRRDGGLFEGVWGGISPDSTTSCQHDLARVSVRVLDILFRKDLDIIVPGIAHSGVTHWRIGGIPSCSGRRRDGGPS